MPEESQPRGTRTPAETKAVDAAEIRRRLARVLERARDELATIEDEHRRVHDELHLVLSSKGRQALLAVRARLVGIAGVVLRPWKLAALPWRWLVALLTRFVLIPHLYHRVRFGSSELRGLPPVKRSTDQASLYDAIRWLGIVRIRGVSWHALFCHPRSSVTFRVPSGVGTQLAVECALHPHVWRKNTGGVQFDVELREDERSWTTSRRLHVDPAGRAADRRWRTVIIPVPKDAGALTLTLSTRLAEGAGPEHAWAIWGEPRLEWKRSWPAILRGAYAALRQTGLRGAWLKFWDLRGRDSGQLLYRRWLELHTPTPDDLVRLAEQAGQLSYRPLISVITPVYNTDPKWLTACVESVRRQVYPHWELCLADDASTSPATLGVLKQYESDPRIRIVHLATNSHISAASNAALGVATGEFVALLDHDDELPPEALFEMAQCLNAHRDADVVYSDEDKLALSGERCDPYFKPDWSPEQLHAFMYINHLTVLRRSLVQRVGGFRVGYEGAQDYDLALRVTERTDRVHHVPKVLYHWRKIPGSAAAETEAKPWALRAARRALEDHVQRSGLEADVLAGALPGLFRVRHRIKGQPLVTIVLPTDDRTRDLGGRVVPLLSNCVQSVVQKTTYANYEILVVDNGRLSETSQAALASAPHRRVSYSYEGAFNFAHKLNFAVRHARGEHLVIFNDDLEVISSEWLSAMLEFSQQPAIGAVGAKLYFPDGRLQHIGMVLGVCGVVAHAFHSHPGSAPGYAASAQTVRNYSAVTGACLMTRRAVFEEAGGFNERLALDFNDVDYCLRVRRLGYRIVYTPYAQLFHLESGTHGPRMQGAHEIEEMRQTWGGLIDRDPYYNPNLTRDFPDYRLGL